VVDACVEAFESSFKYAPVLYSTYNLSASVQELDCGEGS